MSQTSLTTGPATSFPHRWLALGILAASLSLVVLDGTIVGVSLPVIIRELGLTLTDAQWVNSLYNVVFAALLLGVGRLGDRLGRRMLLVVGIGIFVLGSAGAGMATSPGLLIASRAVQGVGGAMVLPSTLSSVNAMFRGRDRMIAFGIWGATMAGMAAIGPLLGAWLTQSFSWRWIFYVNAPLGAIIIVLALLRVPENRGAIAERGIDVAGVVLSAIGFGGLVFALIEGAALGWWRATGDLRIGPLSPVPVAGALGVLALLAFVWHEARRQRSGLSAILRLELFRLPSFSWGNLAAAAIAAGEFGLVFVLPVFLINGRGMGLLKAGWVLAAMALGAFVSGAGARHLSARLGAPGVVVLGVTLELIGMGGLAVVVAREPSTLVVGGLLVVYGIGLGMAAAQLTSTILAKVPTANSGSASATQSTFRQLGSAVGAAVVGTVLGISIEARAGAVVASLPTGRREAIVDAVRDSLGGVLPAWREAPRAPADVAALTHAFDAACGTAVWAAVGFLVLGLLGAVAVLLDSRAVS